MAVEKNDMAEYTYVRKKVHHLLNNEEKKITIRLTLIVKGNDKIDIDCER